MSDIRCCCWWWWCRHRRVCSWRWGVIM